ncbi:AraC family transcriptional regulator [Paenibacillus sp. LPE1-1-1.1]|uniref:AraC family transcriptional regulator n=1 Tax=Paenibacillus sp. LPE1-1-1.1 TaxID=3135230 RepID=UPI00342E5047
MEEFLYDFHAKEVNSVYDPLLHINFRSGNNFGKARCEPGWNWCPLPLSDFDLWYVVSGSGTMRIGNEQHKLAKGSCCLIHPGDRPEANQNLEDRLTVIFIHFKTRKLTDDSVVEQVIPIARHTFVHEQFGFEILLNRILETLELGDAYSLSEFDSLMRLVLYELLRSQEGNLTGDSISAKQRQTVARVSSLIRSSTQGKMTVMEAAQLAGLSAEYLSLLFKKTIGMSLQGFLTKARMERAMHLLTETTMNVSQIADAIGYDNVFLFSRQFKRHFGGPPSIYRRSSVAAVPHGKN